MTADEERAGLVDWELAERVGVMVAGEGPREDRVTQGEIDAAAADTVGLVRAYTKLDPPGELPSPELVGRPEWLRANLAAVRDASVELDRSLAASLHVPGPLGPLSRTAAGAVAGIEAGVALGYLARRVLGQYDVALVGPARPPRLLFVAPNLAEAHRRLGRPRRELMLRWIAMHEATHALQFGAVRWLRDHVGGTVQRLLDDASLRPGLRDLRETARRLLSPPDPRRIAEALAEAGLVGLLAGPRQLDLIRSLQATMTVIEGYSEHVMDAIGGRLDPAYARLRTLAEAQRERQSVLDALVGRLLGLEGKLRQYRVGKRFADSVAQRAGIEGLNEVWREPAALPQPSELERPERWMGRLGVA
jgi:coenzyme F420 biosynthesis associated uncharacterized protein